MEPFVGIIYGPYDLMLPDTTSARTVFVVQQKGGALLPYNVKYAEPPRLPPPQLSNAEMNSSCLCTGPMPWTGWQHCARRLLMPACFACCRFTTTPLALPDREVAAKLSTLTEMFKDDIGRVDFTELWRPFSTLERGVPGGGPVTKLAKLRNALAAHLPEEAFQQAEELLDAVAVELQRVWQLDLGYTVP